MCNQNRRIQTPPKWLIVGGIACGIFLTSPASADIYEGGQIIPDCPDQGDSCPETGSCNLQEIFCDRGEDLDVHTNASTVPEIFHPAGTLTFTLVAEGAGFENEFG